MRHVKTEKKRKDGQRNKTQESSQSPKVLRSVLKCTESSYAYTSSSYKNNFYILGGQH